MCNNDRHEGDNLLIVFSTKLKKDADPYCLEMIEANDDLFIPA